jgi:hypothetical protein
MKLKRRLFKLAFAAGLTYMFDPTLGAQRRRKLRAQIDGWLNRNRKPSQPIVVADRNGKVADGLTNDSELIVPASV